MKADRESTVRGRERLLDAAERLFAEKGYDGASLRAITKAAGVELGLANYHFGSKEELFRQVLIRRAPGMAASLDAALGEALASDSLAAVFASFAETHLARLHDAEPGWRSYIRLAADTALKAPGGLTSAARATYQPVFDRYLAAMVRYRADVPRVELERAFYVFHMAVLSILIDAGPAEGHNSPSLQHVEDLIATMVGIFAKGL